jgi:serine/threonine-protein kinase
MNINTAHFLPGANKRLGEKYLLLECLGDGSHGWVWRAERLADGVTVAVKIPKQLVKDDRLLVEGKELIGTEPHDNIIQIFDMGRVPPEKEWFAIEMEYFPSESLAQKLEHRNRHFSGTYERLLNIFDQVLQAVSHLAGLDPPISHGDIKPHNILIGQGDLAKLTDFGSSALPEEIYVRTRENGGTVLYAAPEYADCVCRKGSFSDLLKGDIYSLGVLLYQLLTAQLPHDTQNQVRTYAPFAKPREVNSGICPLLEQVILRALAKNPDDRFDTIQNFQHAFNLAKTEQLTSSPELPNLQIVQAESDWSTEVVKLMDKGCYEQAAKIAHAAYIRKHDKEALIQQLNALYRADRLHDLQKELAGHPELLGHPGDAEKTIRLIALKTMLKLYQLDDLFLLYEKAIKLDGKNDDLNLIYASALGMQAEYARARDVLEKINQAAPGQVRVLRRLVQVCEQLRDYDAASGYLRAVLRFVRNNEQLNAKRTRYESLGVW